MMTRVAFSGLVKTLTGLNIANNPLEFPPIEIIEGGVQTILAFFREMLRAKSQGKALPGNDYIFLKETTDLLVKILLLKKINT